MPWCSVPEAFTNNGMLTAGKGNSVFSAQRLFLNAPGSLQAGGDVSLNSRSDITISGFTGTAGSLTMNGRYPAEQCADLCGE